MAPIKFTQAGRLEEFVGLKVGYCRPNDPIFPRRLLDRGDQNRASSMATPLWRRLGVGAPHHHLAAAALTAVRHSPEYLWCRRTRLRAPLYVGVLTRICVVK